MPCSRPAVPSPPAIPAGEIRLQALSPARDRRIDRNRIQARARQPERPAERPAESQVPARIRCPSIRASRIRCPKISRIRCPLHVVRLLRRTAGRRSTTTCSFSWVRTTTSCGSARSWLARKDSNLRSPDPESVARIRPREPRFERAAGLSRPPNRGESDAHPEMSQMPIPKTERVCCPIWARQFYLD